MLSSLLTGIAFVTINALFNIITPIEALSTDRFNAARPKLVTVTRPQALQTKSPARLATQVQGASGVAATSQAQTQGDFTGDGTWFYLGLTACGQDYTDNDLVAALSYKLFDEGGTPNPNSKLNERISLT